MTNTRNTFADAAGLLLDDAVATIDNPGEPSALGLLLSAMIERRATLGEYVELLHAIASTATMAVKAELADRIEQGEAAGPAVSFLVRAREGLRELGVRITGREGCRVGSPVAFHLPPGQFEGVAREARHP